jgi:hypothetical protein
MAVAQVPVASVISARRAGFVRNWVANVDAGGRALRRRLMAVLRLAHRTLGARRDRLGLGSLGAGGPVGALLAVMTIMAPQAAFAQVAIGNGVLSNPANCTNPTAATAGSTAIGCGAHAAGATATAIGANTNANGQNSLAIGDSNSATGDGSIIVGYSNSVNGLNAIGMGVFANATGTNALAIGGNAHSNGDGSSSFGVNTTANGVGALALGSTASASGGASIAIGLSSAASSPNGSGTAIGVSSKANAGNRWRFSDRHRHECQCQRDRTCRLHVRGCCARHRFHRHGGMVDQCRPKRFSDGDRSQRLRDVGHGVGKSSHRHR